LAIVRDVIEFLPVHAKDKDENILNQMQLIQQG
jgi:hypothetical protein